MKKIGLIVGLFLMSTIGFASGGVCSCETKEFKTNYEDGSTKLIAEVDCNGNFHGAFVEYFENGTVSGYGEYDHGIKVGTWVVFIKSELGNSFILKYDKEGNRVYAEKSTIDLVLEQK